MVADSGHVLYGLNNYGGTYAKGSIYKYNINTDSITYLASFNGTNGAHPVLKMTKANNGSFYGLIDYCGDSLKGLLYEFNPTNNTITKKADFYGIANGKHPSHPLLLASNGKLYGTTKTGGQYNAGVLFEFNPNTGILTNLVDFSSAKGINPIGNITESGLAYQYIVDLFLNMTLIRVFIQKNTPSEILLAH